MDATPTTLPPLAGPDGAESARGFRWHLIVGGLGLVYGVAGILMHGLTIVGLLLWKPLMGMAGLGEVSMPQALYLHGLFQSGLLLLLGVVLVIGSSLLLLRRPRGAALLRFWAGTRLLMVVVGVVLGIVFMRPQIDFQVDMAERQRDLIAERGGDPSAVPVPNRDSMERQVRWTTAGMSIVLAAFPLFVGIVLTSRRKRDEIAEWGRRES